MSKRRKVSDDEIFNAVHRAMQQHGPHELTLTHIASEAGVTPGLLVQRFGSKRDLLLALSQRFAGSAPALFEQLKAAHPEPLDTLRAYAACMAGLASTPDALSRNLAYLQIDLTDDAFRANLLANARHSPCNRIVVTIRRRGGRPEHRRRSPASRSDHGNGHQWFADVLGLLSRRVRGCVDPAGRRCRFAALPCAPTRTKKKSTAPYLGRRLQIRGACV